MAQRVSTTRFFHSEIHTKRFHSYSGFRCLCDQLNIFKQDPEASLSLSTATKQLVFSHTTKAPKFSNIEVAGPDPKDSHLTALVVFSQDLQLWVPYTRCLYSTCQDSAFRAYARYQAWAAAFTPLPATPAATAIPVQSITGPKLLAAQALASGSTSDQAAAIAKVSPRTIENWKKEPEFRKVRDTFVQAHLANPFPTQGLHLLAELSTCLSQCITTKGKPIPANLAATARKRLMAANAFLAANGASSSLTTTQEPKP